MAFFQLNNWDIPIEEGTLRRSSKRGGASRSAGGKPLLDRSHPFETYTFDTCILTPEEHEGVAAYFVSTLGTRTVVINGDYSGDLPDGVFAIFGVARITNTKFLTRNLAVLSIEVVEFAS